MVSRSRRIGASPSIKNEVRVPELTRTVSPITIRSNGFSSTRSGTIIPRSKTCASAPWPATFAKHRSCKCAADVPPDYTQGYWIDGGGGISPAALIVTPPYRLAEQLQHAPLRLVGQR